MKIKRFTLLSLSLGVLSVGAFVGFTNDRTAKYHEREVLDNDSGDQTALIGSSMKFLQMIRANTSTGEVSYGEYAQAVKQLHRNRMAGNKALDISWDFLGPDNVGGRTRTLVIDRNDPNTLYAGSTSGGIFVSNDAGDSWQSYSNDLENNAIASMVQAVDGDIYFSTGPIFDSPFSDDVTNKDVKSIFLGSGVYKLTGNGGVQKLTGPTTSNSTTVDWAMTAKLATDPVDPEVLYAAMNNGFRYSHDGGQTWNTPTGISLTAGAANDVEVASDGTVMVTFDAPSQLYKSTDKGLTFTQMNNLPFGTNSSRIEYAIAPSDPNVHYASIADGSQCLFGVFQSIDKGQTWERIIGPSQDHYDFFHNGRQCIGSYTNAITVYPNNPYKILVGGVTLFRWEQTTTPPTKPNGSIVELGSTLIMEDVINPYYLHSNKHGLYFSNDSILYIVTDGGVAKSTNANHELPGEITFDAINFNYSTAQYFAMGYGPNGLLIGGTQSNGTNFVGFDYNLGKSGYEIVTSEYLLDSKLMNDGFDCDISNLDPSTAFASHPYGQVKKITGIDSTLGRSNFSVSGSIYNDDFTLNNRCGSGSCGTYYTAMRLWESFYDTTSQTQVTFDLIVDRGETVPVGTKLQYKSMTNSIPLMYTTTQAYFGPTSVDSVVIKGTDTITYPIDTLYKITATDYVQSILVAGNLDYNGSTHQSSVYMTRHAIHGNLGAPVDWIKIAGGAEGGSVALIGQIITMEFSKDGNHLFVGTARPGGGGDLYRISGINDVYSDLDGTTFGARKTSTTLLASLGQGAITGIAVDPNNAENVIITCGNYGHNQYVFRSTSAVSSSFGSFVSIMGAGATALPNAPVYDAVIDYHHNDTVLVGTDFGVFSTANAFDPDPNNVQWSYESNGLPRVPVYELRQQTFGFGDSSRGISNTGEIYIATHGRGLFKSDELVGINDRFDDKEENEQSLQSSLKIFPNPAIDHSSLSFVLPSTRTVVAKIYNINGKLVKEASFGRLSSGEHRIEIDARDLSTGSYILQLIADDMAATSKFVIQK